MANSTWRGAIEFKVNGFPVPVNVRLYARVKGPKKGDGFKLVSPEGKPVVQKYLTLDGDWQGTISECARGVEVVRGKVQKLDDTVIQQISDHQRSAIVRPDSFAPMASIDLALARASYIVVPEDEVHEGSCRAIWQGLQAGNLAYVTRIILRAGSPDSLLAIYADKGGLKAVSLPREGEVNDDLDQGWEFNPEDGAKFIRALEDEYEVRPLNAAEHPSDYGVKRQALLEKALAGIA